MFIVLSGHLHGVTLQHARSLAEWKDEALYAAVQSWLLSGQYMLPYQLISQGQPYASAQDHVYWPGAKRHDDVP